MRTGFSTMMRAGLAAMAMMGALNAASAETLTVYAPDYFGSEWGPGPALKAGFEAECGCTLDLRTGEVMARLVLEGGRTEADAVIGLFDAQRNRVRRLLGEHQQDLSRLTLPVEWADEVFLPYDWSHLAFVYDTDRLEAEVPSSLMELAASDIQLVLQDPRSSPAGLALLFWVEEALGADQSEVFWAEMADNILTFAPGWTEAYGLFTSDMAPMTLSFTTSPAYHLLEENDDSIRAAIFEEGHPAYIELAAITATTDQPELATKFMNYLISNEFQQELFRANWSFAAALPETDWPETFRNLPRPTRTLWWGPEDLTSGEIAEIIARWRAGVLR